MSRRFSALALVFAGLALFASAAPLLGQRPGPDAPAPPFGVAVTPDGLAGPNRAINSSGHSETFWVTNFGTNLDTYTLTCSGTFNVTCTGISQTSVTLAGGTNTTVTAYYSVGGTGLGRLNLNASGEEADDAYWTVPVVIPTYQVAVTPDGASQWASIPSSGQQVTNFSVENRGNIGTLTYNLTIASCLTPLSPCTSDSASVTIPQGESRPIPARFFVQNVVGVGTIALRATHGPSGTFDDGSVRVATTSSPLDDSLPTTPITPVYSLLPGALPLPHDSLKGCPVVADNPEIRLVSPSSYVVQPQVGVTNEGNLFMAQAVWDTTFDVTAVWRDYVAADQKTCAGSTYLTETQYAWTYWLHGNPSDPLWNAYPYGDRVGTSSAGVGIKDPNAVPMPQHSTAGAINANSYQVRLNGTLIVNNGVPVAGVALVSSSATGATYRVSNTLANKYDATEPAANNGGWNELKASIADLSGRRSTIRARFVAVGPGVVKTLQLTALRDFAHLAQGDCAAFAAFQCGGVTVVQTIPGFITRDKNRGLHLIYRSASQRAPTLLAQQLIVSRLQMAPDSVHLTALDSMGIAVGRTMRYAGTRVAAGTPVVASTDTLRQNADENRVVGAEVAAPASDNAAIRRVNVRVRGFSPGIHDTLVAYEVVQLYLSDTSATRFGLGWQLAAVSRLVFGQTYQGAPAAIWLSGDGSYTILRQVGGVWVSFPGETAKLLDSLTTPGLAARFVVSLNNGATVGYRGDGWQAWTADLVGNRTRFWYAAAGAGRLDSIVDPANIGYRFTYTNGQVTDIWVRHASQTPTKVATLLYGGPSGRWLTQVKIWRSTVSDSTKFAYATASTYGAYLDTIIDPRHTAAKPIRTTFTYDSLFATVTSAVRPPENSGQSLDAKLWDHWRRALPRAGRGVAPTVPAERTVLSTQLVGTSRSFGQPPVDFAVDRFGGPTYVRRLAGSGGTGDDVRRITRDSLGRVLRITHAPDSAAITDSVVYRYDAFNRVDRIIRNTVGHPATTFSLDTITFTYDSVTLSGGVRCHRLRSMRDAMGGITKANYDSTGAGIRPCLPLHAIGLAADTTKFTYGPLTVGHPASARPVLVRDPNGLRDSVQYDVQTWNSAVLVRNGDNATTTVHFDSLGRPDYVVNPVGTRTDYRYDLSGRLLKAKTGGTSTTAPTTATFYNAANLVDRVEVYSSPGGVDETPVGVIQVTKYYYDRLGRVDSTDTPGGRRIRYPTRDAFGNPVLEYPGNNTLIVRLFDWQGRQTTESPSQVSPYIAAIATGQTFASPLADSVYESLNLSSGVTLSPGQGHSTKYDNKGRVVWTASQQAGETDSIIVHRLGYTRAGVLIADTVRFRGGARVIRTFEYNRRGQRTLARDTIVLLGSGTLSGERGGTVRYYYKDTTARMDSMVGTSGSVKVAKIRWVYDRGGRDSVRVVRLGSGSGYASDSLRTRFTYDAAGRVSVIVDSSNFGVWHRFISPVYNLADQLKSAQGRRPSTGGGPANAYDYTSNYTYDSVGGTWRLLTATRSNPSSSNTYTYDVFGNPLTEFYNQGTGPGCDLSGNDNSTFGPDNELVRTVRNESGCARNKRYWHDGAGNRLVQLDTNSGSGLSLGPQTILSYTARNELFFSMTWTIQVGTYDYNWHWYDGGGRRVITRRGTGSTWNPQQDTTGAMTYYVYDGTDVALTLVKTGTNWWTKGRYLTLGIDQVLAGRFATTGLSTANNLALIADRQGTTLAAMKFDGTQESNATYFTRDPFGGLPGVSGSEGSINTETGYTGASTPNGTGGFAYLRNRWYDPQTGRFLTQDPIGMAGGVNLYGYAGNNPITFTDPFGLCPIPVTDCPPGYFTAWGATIGAAAGAATGGAAGGAAGALVGAGLCAPTGPGALACGAAGGTVGAAGGAATGAVNGAIAGALAGAVADVTVGVANALGNIFQMADAGKGRGANRGPNAEARRAANERNLNSAGRDELHKRISKRGLTGEEIEQEALDIANHSKWVNPQ